MKITLSTIVPKAPPTIREEKTKEIQQEILAKAKAISMKERKPYEALLSDEALLSKPLSIVYKGQEHNEGEVFDYVKGFLKEHQNEFCLYIPPLFKLPNRDEEFTCKGEVINLKLMGCHNNTWIQHNDPSAWIFYLGPCAPGDIEVFETSCRCSYIAMQCGTQTIPALQTYLENMGLVAGTDCTILC